MLISNLYSLLSTLAISLNYNLMSISTPQQPIDLLLVGHVTRDLIGETPQSGWRLGGTVSFAAITALRLGRKPTIITRAAQTSDLGELPDEVARVILPAQATTTFANIYTAQGRVQYCYTPAPAIRAEDIPTEFRQPNVVLLGPLVDEIGPDVPPIFDDETLVVAVPQGWMRNWDETGRVSAKPWASAEAILPYLDVLVLSLEDIAFDLSRLELFFKFVPTVVLTEYRDGSTLYQRNAAGELIETKIPPAAQPTKLIQLVPAISLPPPFCCGFRKLAHRSNRPVLPISPPPLASNIQAYRASPAALKCWNIWRNTRLRQRRKGAEWQSGKVNEKKLQSKCQITTLPLCNSATLTYACQDFLHC